VSALAIDATALLSCCGSRRWQDRMTAVLPCASAPELLAASERAFDTLSREDWMQAFRAHSMIGAPRDGDRTGAGEQSGLDGADGDLRMALAAANLEYQTRFGFVFLIRARGRSAEELLAALHDRLDHSPESEFQIACDQQREITALRLSALVAAQDDAGVREGSS
jgi:OHCU decarboxylase